MVTPLTIGWWGKLPARGDFVGRGLPRAWQRAWDEWLQRGLASATRRWGPGLRERLLEMPPWQAIVWPAAGDAPAWTLVVVPSQDRVGRAFPLLLAEPHDAGALGARPLAAWCERARGIGVWALEALPRSTPRDLEAGIARWAATPWPETDEAPDGRIVGLHERWPAAGSFWWPASAEGDLRAPQVQPWPPRESLLFDWLGEDDTAPGEAA